MKNILVVITAFVFLPGCMSFYNLPAENLAVTDYPSTHKIKPENILVQKKYGKPSDINFAFLKIDSSHEPQKHYDFLARALSDLGIPAIYTEEDIVENIISRGLDVHSTSTSDLLSLKRLADSMGKFIVVESEIKFIYSARWENYLKVVDASIPETLLEIREGDVVWSNFDKEISYPNANLLREVFTDDL